MKTTTFYVICLWIFFVGSMNAQEHRSKEERIKALKVAFITEELDLSPKQSQGFWPLYNELHDKLEVIRKKFKVKPDLDQMTDEEIELFLENHLKLGEEKIELHRVYIQKFKKVINLKQIARLSLVERKFKRELLMRSKEKRGEGPHPRHHRR